MMKKNMVPLLAIAFVVAIVSTGIFYGLFASKLSNTSTDLPRQNVLVAARKIPRGAVLAASDVHVAEVRGRTGFGNAFTKPEQVIGATVVDAVDEEQMLTRSGLASANGADGSSVPAGMRAVTLHIFESGGVLALLRPGSRVDIQAISDRNNGAAELRSVLQNIEVLATGLQPELVALHYSAPTVTVLVHAEDSDLIAIADAGSRLRLALRNRLDDASAPHAPVAVASVFTTRREGGAATTPVAPARSATPRKPVEALVVWERVVSVNEKGAQEFAAAVKTPLDPNTTHVTAFRANVDADSLLQRMEAGKELVVLSSRSLSHYLPMPVGSGLLIGRLNDDQRHELVIITPRRPRAPLAMVARTTQD